jgi:hypothetical protein
VLRARHRAEKFDKLNKIMPDFQRYKTHLVPKARRRDLKALADNKITLQQYIEMSKRTEEAARPVTSVFDPLFSVRSDKGGTRRQTISCGTMSDIIHYATGKWHDAEVAALCEIAFDCECSTDAVRSARRKSIRKSN